MPTYTEIPISETDPDFSLIVPLSGENFLLRFKWNMRSGWYLGVSDAASSSILAPRKIAPDWPLMRLCVDSRRPPGDLYLIDTTQKGDYPTRNSLGSRHRLVYVD